MKSHEHFRVYKIYLLPALVDVIKINYVFSIVYC